MEKKEGNTSKPMSRNLFHTHLQNNRPVVEKRSTVLFPELPSEVPPKIPLDIKPLRFGVVGVHEGEFNCCIPP